MGRVLEVISILEKYPITREALESCYSSTFRWSTWDVFLKLSPYWRNIPSREALVSCYSSTFRWSTWDEFLKLSPYWRNIPSQEKLLSHAILFSGGQHGTFS